jgi:hypothetical protein
MDNRITINRFRILDEIVIETKRVKKDTIKSRLLVPDRIKKYIKTQELFVIYDKEVTSNDSILNIPLVSNVLPLAWLTDCDIQVDSLDKRYSESMFALKEELNNMYPAKPYKTEINASRFVENKVEAKGAGLLFSGGVDSTYSLISNWEKRPHLIIVWGIDMHPYPEYRSHWEGLESIYSRFSERHGLEFSMIKTNASQILDEKRINHDFYKELESARFRMRHQHTLIIVPLLAPFSIKRFNEIIFSASIWPSYSHQGVSSTSIPRTDEKIVWADLTTKHSGFIHRFEKFSAIAEFMKEHELTLKVCDYPELNCCRCEKCMIAIITLVLHGLDPNDCGFNVNEETFKYLRKFYEKAPLRKTNITSYLLPIKKMIPNKLENDFYGSKQFFLWFKDFNLNSNTSDKRKYRVIYNKLPFFLANTYDKLLRKRGIDIQHIHS